MIQLSVVKQLKHIEIVTIVDSAYACSQCGVITWHTFNAPMHCIDKCSRKI